MPNRRIPAEFAVWAALIASLVLFGATTFTTYRSTAQLRPVLDDVSRTRLLEITTSRLLSQFRESQSERRAYLLTGDDYFLRQHRASFDSARHQLRLLAGLTDGKTAHRARMRRIAELLMRADSIGRVTIEVRRTRGLQAAAALVASRVGHNVVQEVETAVRTVEIVEQENLSMALDVARQRAERARNIAIASAVLALLLLPAAAFIVWKDLLARRRSARQLRHATRDAEAATKAKSEFLASMSHEIRTPLNGVIGMTELALDTDLTPTQRDYLQTARSSAESLLRLLNDILDFSKIEAGRLDLEATPFPLRDVIGETLRTLSVRAEQKKLQLAYRVLPSVPDILVGDPGRLQQVLINLVGNAIKFTERGEIVVVVESQALSGSETTLHVSVKDTGIGIPPDRTRAIFDLFSQADSSTTRRFGGTGLGLTISEQLVKLMGGSIWVESEVGKGSTFHFTLRLGVGEQAALPRASLEQLDGLRVLVVDDHPTNRFILEETLSHWHMRPVSADGGEAGIQMARDAAKAGAPVQVAILDFIMPGIDGYQLAEVLVRERLLPGSSIIFLSSDNQPGNAAKRAALGITRSLMKPVKQSELLDAILTAAAGHAPPSPAAASKPTSRWSGARVLVVEDNEVNQRVARGLLEKRGIEVVIANNGREAVDLLAGDRDRFGLVMMDVEMPVMDGVEATKEIRHREGGGARVPIVAVTAHALAEEKERCERAGMDLCLTKPLRSVDLDEALDRFLGVATAASAPGAQQVLDERRALGQEMLAIVDGDRDLLAIIAAEYLKQTPPLLEELTEAVERSDAVAVSKVAHRLKGSSLQLAGTRVGAVAGHLEDQARAGNLAQANALLQDLQAAMNDFAVAVRAAADGRA